MNAYCILPKHKLRLHNRLSQWWRLSGYVCRRHSRLRLDRMLNIGGRYASAASVHQTNSNFHVSLPPNTICILGRWWITVSLPYKPLYHSYDKGNIVTPFLFCLGLNFSRNLSMYVCQSIKSLFTSIYSYHIKQKSFCLHLK